MKANELRIGNWVNSMIEIGVFYDVMVTKNDFNGNIDLFKPIPLTEEWLARFGFVKCFYEEGGLRLPWYKLRTDDCLFEIDYEFSYTRDDGGYIKIQHVHSLQNLYFALTGEELTIK